MNLTPDPKSESENLDCGCSGTGADTSSLPSSQRRRIIRAGASAGPVLFALSGRSAMATTTTRTCQFPSSWASLNPGVFGQPGAASAHPHDDGCGLGGSPGFWKQPQKRKHWPGTIIIDTNQNGSTTPVPDSLKCIDQSFGQASCDKFRADGSKINNILPGASATNQTMSQLLCTENGTDAWHFTAALLNAWGVTGYPLTVQNVIDMWNGVFTVSGTTWTRAQARQYIEAMYHTTGSPTGVLKYNNSVACKN